MKTQRLLSLTCAILLISPVFANDKKGLKDPSALEPHKPVPGKKSEKRSVQTNTSPKPGPSHNLTVRIEPAERQIIQSAVHEYSKPANKGKALPPGLAKKAAKGRDLPPGWRKKMVVGQVIPEPVFKHCHPLPPEIVVKLPAPPHGTILVGIEGKILRVSKASREILDIFDLR